MADDQKPQTGSGSGAEDGGIKEGLSLDGEEQSQSPQPDSGVVTNGAAGQTKKKVNPIKAFVGRFSIYLLLFVLVIVVALMVVAIAYVKSHSKQSGPTSTQTLSQNSLKQLSSSDVTVGDVKQTLNVQSNAVFAGQVLIQKDLEVAGKLQIGGSLSLTGINVSGSSVFETIQINKNLTIAGDTAMQGQLSVQKNINVNGSGTFAGNIAAPQITTNSLQLNGDLVLTHHINAGGVNPGRTNGSALGGGGTASVSGSDTAGSITINTGGNTIAGCMITVNFATKFNSTPHVVVSPVDVAAASTGYYVTRTTSSFSVCASNVPPAGQTFGFDYIVVD